MGEFGARFAPSLLEEGEYDHTAFLYLVQKEPTGYTVKKIFTRVPFTKEVIGQYLVSQKSTDVL